MAFVFRFPGACATVSIIVEGSGGTKGATSTLGTIVSEAGRSDTSNVTQQYAQLRVSLTFELMLHECHRVIFFTGFHCLDTRAEARNWQDNNVTNLLRLRHASEMGESNVATAGAHVEVGGIVEEGKDAVGP